MKGKKYLARKDATKATMELVQNLDISLADKLMITGMLTALYKDIVGSREAEKMLDELLAEVEG